MLSDTAQNLLLMKRALARSDAELFGHRERYMDRALTLAARIIAGPGRLQVSADTVGGGAQGAFSFQPVVLLKISERNRQELVSMVNKEREDADFRSRDTTPSQQATWEARAALLDEILRDLEAVPAPPGS